MYPNCPAAVENILQQQDLSPVDVTTGESSSRTCTSTNTSKSENNEQSSFSMHMEDENCLFVSATNDCIPSKLPCMQQIDNVSYHNDQIQEDKKRVNSMYNENMNILAENSLFFHQRRQSLEGWRLSSCLTNLKPCETCGKMHNGSFASGRFCSSKCARTVGGIARKKQRMQNKNKENNARIVPRDKFPLNTKVLKRMWTEFPYYNQQMAERLFNQTISGSYIPHQYPSTQTIPHDQQQFHIAESLCSLEDIDRIQKTNKLVRETGFHQNERCMERMKAQHSKMDVTSLLN
ncbi:hypothetical protein GAYE_PCTG70G1524 [Galdieria yellowstonensis]|uniref:Uncharacterized protein n=1 Tax=Galdieria yellowstonensis TaxID=3028027 RepID=A0AAV9I8E6_9RHOD|nr:hypothetical protein GAYE_PCTG70G1524 [Galdieria yellowstonensis]